MSGFDFIKYHFWLYRLFFKESLMQRRLGFCRQVKSRIVSCQSFRCSLSCYCRLCFCFIFLLWNVSFCSIWLRFKGCPDLKMRFLAVIFSFSFCGLQKLQNSFFFLQRSWIWWRNGRESEPGCGPWWKNCPTIKMLPVNYDGLKRNRIELFLFFWLFFVQRQGRAGLWKDQFNFCFGSEHFTGICIKIDCHNQTTGVQFLRKRWRSEFARKISTWKLRLRKRIQKSSFPTCVSRDNGQKKGDNKSQSCFLDQENKSMFCCSKRKRIESEGMGIRMENECNRQKPAMHIAAHTGKFSSKWQILWQFVQTDFNWIGYIKNGLAFSFVHCSLFFFQADQTEF